MVWFAEVVGVTCGTKVILASCRKWRRHRASIWEVRVTDQVHTW